MGYHGGTDLSAENTVEALKMAVSGRITKKALIHHSDRGLQYAASVSQAELQKHQIRPSMTDGGDCYQNALAERINGILKQEFLLSICQNRQQLEVLMKESIEIYNRERPHLNLGMNTSDSIHKKACEDDFTGSD